MKPKILIFSLALLIVNLSSLQLLYTENFESYNTGTYSPYLTIPHEHKRLINCGLWWCMESI